MSIRSRTWQIAEVAKPDDTRRRLLDFDVVSELTENRWCVS